MDDKDFETLRQEAARRIREMKQKADGDIPVPPFVNVRGRPGEDRREPKRDFTQKENERHKKTKAKEENPLGFLGDIFSRINLPFSGNEGESDTTLLLALLLLFLDKSGDRLLLYALIYILL